MLRKKFGHFDGLPWATIDGLDLGSVLSPAHRALDFLMSGLTELRRKHSIQILALDLRSMQDMIYLAFRPE